MCLYCPAKPGCRKSTTLSYLFWKGLKGPSPEHTLLKSWLHSKSMSSQLVNKRKWNSQCIHLYFAFYWSWGVFVCVRRRNANGWLKKWALKFVQFICITLVWTEILIWAVKVVNALKSSDRQDGQALEILWELELAHANPGNSRYHPTTKRNQEKNKCYKRYNQPMHRV